MYLVQLTPFNIELHLSTYGKDTVFTSTLQKRVFTKSSGCKLELLNNIENF